MEREMQATFRHGRELYGIKDKALYWRDDAKGRWVYIAPAPTIGDACRIAEEVETMARAGEPEVYECSN